ncbi:(2Fe-2S)-binding protein [bacterium]|nr:(2Fe-2S)-binding protein [bacterium]
MKDTVTTTKKPLLLFVNGKRYDLMVEPGARLLDVLRDECALTGTKEGCGVGECGACTVLVRGGAACSCLLFAHSFNGEEITTIEGMADELRHLHPLQEELVKAGGCQCGFCIPGMLLAAKQVLDRNPDPTEEEILTGLSGNLCRCTGYSKIIEAVQEAGRILRDSQSEVGAK